MKVVKIELINDIALGLLKQLEKLNILRLISSKKQKSVKKREWAGSLSKETAREMLKSVDQSRNEWERNIKIL